MKLIQILLFPFSVVYHLITGARNRLYDQGLKPVARFEIPVISVGNLAVGGTGKTPMIEHLIRLLNPVYQVATLSRGYGRRTKGIRIAGDKDDASTLGDEPFQFHRKFRDKVSVAVGEERALAIPYLIDEKPDTQVILLDDAFQHRSVQPSFQILLTDYSRLFHRDLLLPAGRLRESKHGAERADVVVVTKCPRVISEEEMIAIETGIKVYASRPVFFSTLRYNAMVPVGEAGEPRDSVVLVTGIANARSLHQHIRGNFRIVRHFDFPDHHIYSTAEVSKIAEVADKHRAMVITTEKDAAKLGSSAFGAFVDKTPFFYLPVEIEFVKNGKDFDEMVLNAVKNAWKKFA